MLTALLTLPRFAATFVALILWPLRFFRGFHERVGERDSWSDALLRERPGDRYLDPAKFAAVSITLGNLLLPLMTWYGVQTGAISQDFVRFAEWAEAQGYLEPLSFTGIWFVDDAIRDAITVGIFTVLGLLIALFSAGAIPAKFATGYYFYFSAWTFLSDLATAGLVFLGVTTPVMGMPLPALVSSAITVIAVFMFFAFPIIFWPRIMPVSTGRVALAVLLGLAVWITALAVIASMVVEVPDLSNAPVPGRFEGPGRP